ncbi:MAG: methyltransferase [Phycisphaerae bacterium]|nr:methyltransferase [Phycisphaerae bacterium]NIP54665.1 methyltransferase [Phycisphaerae bacterium]NIS53534.1 methyltransferase [Phycisphaerae bacterium]NIU10994.1 methyltransferase [Phycisphaerae bacterium]NIU58877.1 methyltransferase [Phycisphaerae bacterium]
MTSRERILAALNHNQPDRVPIDFSGHRSSGIAAMAYPKLREFLDLPPRPIRVYDVIQQLAIVDEDVLDRFGVDTIELGRGFALDEESWSPWTLPDGTPCLVPSWTHIERDDSRWVIRSKTGRIFAQMPNGTLYFEQTHYPFLDGDDLQNISTALEESMWTAVASPPGPIDSQSLSEGAKRLREETGRAIIGLFGGNLFEIGQFLYRNDQFMMLLAAEPKRANDFLDKLVEIHLANLEKFLTAVGEYIDIILFGDDLGMQTGPMISPQMYRELFKPRHKLLWNHAKKLADVKVMLHCCGGVLELMPDLIEAGVDAINPVQISCSGMDAGRLKAEFGKDITFWGGGCDTRDILPNGTPQQVAENVKEQVRILHPGGGFVFQQVHNILANIPPANVVAMFDAVNGDSNNAS